MYRHLYAEMCWSAFGPWTWQVWNGLKSKTARRACRLDVPVKERRDHRRLAGVARNWVRHNKGGPYAFLRSLRTRWPSGVDRLGERAIEAAYHLAAGGFL